MKQRQLPFELPDAVADHLMDTYELGSYGDMLSAIQAAYELGWKARDEQEIDNVSTGSKTNA